MGRHQHCFCHTSNTLQALHDRQMSATRVARTPDDTAAPRARHFLQQDHLLYIAQQRKAKNSTHVSREQLLLMNPELS
jgi:hypothetical protein